MYKMSNTLYSRRVRRKTKQCLATTKKLNRASHCEANSVRGVSTVLDLDLLDVCCRVR